LEVIFVDDGSSDGSPRKIEEICRSDPRIRLVQMSRNFGHQAAITAGIDHSIGDAVVVMDGDLQDPPEVIPAMVNRWRGGAKVVYGVREVRAGDPKIKKIAAAVHYRLLRWLSDTDIPLDSGDFRLMDRQVVDALGTMRESSRYLRGMVAWLGFRQEALFFKRDRRFAGAAKYDFRRTLRLSLDGITSFTDRPLKLASQVGIAITLFAGLYGLWIILARLADPDRAQQGFAAIMVTMLGLGGVQLFAIGIVGQYLGRVYTQTKGRPLYIVKKRVGWVEKTRLGPGVGSDRPDAELEEPRESDAPRERP
jgi:dolichol-phosphate mannosyltransferase